MTAQSFECASLLNEADAGDGVYASPDNNNGRDIREDYNETSAGHRSYYYGFCCEFHFLSCIILFLLSSRSVSPHRYRPRDLTGCLRNWHLKPVQCASEATILDTKGRGEIKVKRQRQRRMNGFLMSIPFFHAIGDMPCNEDNLLPIHMIGIFDGRKCHAS